MDPEPWGISFPLLPPGAETRPSPLPGALAFWEKTPEGLYYCQEFLRLGPFKDKKQFTDLYPNYQKDREFFVTGNRYAYLFDNEQGHYLNYGGQILGPFKAEPDVFLGPNGLDPLYTYPRISEDGRSFTLFLKDKDYTYEF